MNFKEQEEICVINAPESFLPNMKEMEAYAAIKTDLAAIEKLHFFVAFVQTPEEVEKLAPSVSEKLEGDGLVWFCYPKKSSKKYKSQITRDNGWQIMGQLDFEGVRMVAVDQDWSGLRFRKVQFIKTMKRAKSFAMTKEGKSKTTDRK